MLIRKYIYKGNSCISLFEIHKSTDKKNKSGLQTKTEGNTSNIYRGQLRHNRNTTLNVTHTDTNYEIKMAIFLTWYRTF